MAAKQQRAAAARRREAAERTGERLGESAYRAFRRSAPGVGRARRVPMQTEIRAVPEMRNGKEMIHTFGYYTTYGRLYPMWDQFGEYEESARPGSGARTLASSPDTAFLVNHAGVTMARTTNGTLLLAERSESTKQGGWHDGWLNPQRQDVSDLVVAINDRNVDQMSFAFMIPEGGGLWSEDWTHFEIIEYDIDRGDVSAVNYGANPYTDISASAPEVLNAIDHLPEGAMRAVVDRATRRSPAPVRERIEVRAPRAGTAPSAQRLEGRMMRAAGRYADLAAREGLSVAEVMNVALPWYEIRNATGDVEPDGGGASEPGVATILMYDEIGGSYGVSAKQFAVDLAEITAPQITVRINSPGGSVRDGIAIHSSLIHHPAKVKVVVDSMAASAASVIAMAADPYDPDTGMGGVEMMPGSQMMLHDASATDDGNAAEKQKMVTFLDRQSQNLAEMYARRAGGDPEEWREIMLAETWAFAQESVDLGLADRVVHTREPVADPDAEEKLTRSHDLAPYHYRHAGRRGAPDPLQTRGQIRQRVARGEAPLGTPESDGAQASTERSTPEPANGRSISAVEAWLATSERE